jgi:hypothetical protein
MGKTMAFLEASAFAEWVRTSFVGYPALLTLHSVGMAIMVGLVFVVCLRLVGKFQRLPLESLDKLLGIAWIGFAINLLSGLGIFTSQATFYVTSAPFLLKMAAVLVGAGTIAYLQPVLRRNEGGWLQSDAIPGGVRNLATLSLVVWSVAIVTGRFTAYL